jgi:hypothetical protein
MHIEAQRLRITSGTDIFQVCTAFTVTRISFPVWFIRLLHRS